MVLTLDLVMKQWWRISTNPIELLHLSFELPICISWIAMDDQKILPKCEKLLAPIAFCVSEKHADYVGPSRFSISALLHTSRCLSKPAPHLLGHEHLLRQEETRYC